LSIFSGKQTSLLTGKIYPTTINIAMSLTNRLISVCVCTYNRPEALLVTLQSLDNLILPSFWTLEVVVTDNAPDASAMKATQIYLRNQTKLQIRYFHEMRPGVSHARNRCLSEARGEFVAFIDDDEFADCDWLHHLVTCLEKTNADAVFGPVLPAYAAKPPDWLISSQINERTRFPSGTLITWGEARTGNVMIRRSILAGNHIFSDRFARSGGEDSYFFASAQKRGCRLVWCDEAVVTENIPADRMQKSWLLQRALMGGRTYVRLHACLGHPLSYIYFAIRGLLSAPLSLTFTFIFLIKRDPRYMYHLCKLYGHFGKIVAYFYNAGHYAGTS
jgi:succinoglycan biosynthesis protein ExoM